MKVSKRCLNCNSIVRGNFCSDCGQQVDTQRVGFKQLIEELQYGILHINKGILYTTKELLIRPAVTIENYLSGKRIKYTKPLVFLLIWGAVYSVIFHFFHYFPMEEMNHPDNDVLEYLPLYRWVSGHYSFLALFLIPVYAWVTSLLFRAKGCNYAEHVVVFSYILGATTFLILLFYPLIYLTKSPFIYQWVHILVRLYMVWALAQFYKTSSWIKAVAKIILCVVIIFLILLIITVIMYESFKYYDIRL